MAWTKMIQKLVKTDDTSYNGTPTVQYSREFFKSVEIPAGLYDAAGNMIASWDALVTTYGLNVEQTYNTAETLDNYYKTTPGSGYYMFTQHPTLTQGSKLIIDASAQTFGGGAFAGCTSLTEVVLSNVSVGLVGANLFYECTNLTTSVVGAGVNIIPSFANCSSLKNVILAEGLTSFNLSAFLNCTSLESIVIPTTLTNWANTTFAGCTSLRYIFIHQNATGLNGTNSMNPINSYQSWCRGTTSLAYIEVDDNNPTYKSVEGNVYTKDGKTLIMYALGKQNSSFAIPDFVTTISNAAFDTCTHLKDVYIPSSVTTIGNSAFRNCTSLESITIPASVELVDSHAFRECSNLKTVVFRGKPQIPISSLNALFAGKQFEGCTSLTEIHVPWAEGEVAGSPWGAPNATIHYNYTG